MFDLYRSYSKYKKIILSLESKVDDMKVELDKVKNVASNKCETLG